MKEKIRAGSGAREGGKGKSKGGWGGREVGAVDASGARALPDSRRGKGEGVGGKGEKGTADESLAEGGHWD